MIGRPVHDGPLDTAMNYQCLKNDRAPDAITIDLSHLEEQDPFNRIRCPLCAWQPSAQDRWACISGPGPEPPFLACGTSWNTFATRGRCPGCAHQWRWTSCLRCGEWSPHDDWYEKPDEDVT